MSWCRTRIRWAILVAVPIAWFAAGCDSTDTGSESFNVEDIIDTTRISLNPSGYAPLTASLFITTREPVQVEILIRGRISQAGDVQYRHPDTDTQHLVPVLGLYGGVENLIYIRLYDGDGTRLGETSRTVTTSPLITELPQVSVEVNTGRRKPGMNLVSYFGHQNQDLPQIPFIFDSDGDIRWFINTDPHPVLAYLFYDAGVERLRNGNLYFGDGSSGNLVEMDMMGNVVNLWPLVGYGYHHNVLELPNGNLLATVNKHGLQTIEDHIVEIDRNTGALVTEWDLRQSLDSRRRTWSANFGDWFHANGLAYDESSDAIIVSGRHQGVVKLTRSNEVIWLLAPHRGWRTAGDRSVLATKLLQPLDAQGQPITDRAVLEGTTNHPDFEWNWYQHAPKLVPDGHLLLFDNGDRRNYTFRERYSRAVIYRIDEQNMTVQQVWQYGKERGDETLAPIVSDVDYHEEQGTIAFMPGAIWSGGEPHGRTVEVDVDSREIVYEARIFKPSPHSGITFHRIERLPLYPTHNL
ncbi:MAG: aryl-sulfate sulfotransferase [Bacteroidota bacterium]|nr:aryl-sulfate sulfotransferase [Bacteroidota bacterium]MDE2956715.1 aryl-sulfate sulfotransferase [Bacteroidota bacterium]